MGDYAKSVNDMRDSIIRWFGVPTHLVTGVPPAPGLIEEFVCAIAANPQDATLRAIFADWLEEQGDPRAAEVRQTLDREPIARNGCWSDYTVPDLLPKDLSELPRDLHSVIKELYIKMLREERKIQINNPGPNLYFYEEAWTYFGKGFALWFGVEVNDA